MTVLNLILRVDRLLLCIASFMAHGGSLAPWSCCLPERSFGALHVVLSFQVLITEFSDQINVYLI